MNQVNPPSLNLWPLWVRLEKSVSLSRGWQSIHWQVAEVSHQPLQHPDACPMPLQLYRDERSAYRFNLSSQAPKLFVICEECEETMRPRIISACQDQAADYMDAGQPVLDIPMPAAIHAWIEAFMAHHGEWVDPRDAKRRMRGQPREEPQHE